MNTRSVIALLCALPSACVSDLAVGMSVAEISANEAGSPAEGEDAGTSTADLDAGMEPSADAAVDAAPELDAALPDAAPPDAAARDAASSKDASVDAARDAGRWIPCSEGDCLIGFTTLFDGCSEASVQRCGRPSPEQVCEWYCQ